MREKNENVNSYLNQRLCRDIAQQTVTCVQTEVLTPATIKIVDDIQQAVNPYSSLMREYVNVEARANMINFVIDSAEIAKSEVKLPAVNNESIVKSEVIEKKEKIEEHKEVKRVEHKLPEIQIVDAASKTPQMSDMEILNSLAKYQDAPQQKTETNLQFDIPKDVQLIETSQETTTNDLQVLNELQAEETKVQKVNKSKAQVNSAMNGLEGLLAELGDFEEPNQLGLG